MGILDPRRFDTDTYFNANIYAPDAQRRGLFAHLPPSMPYGGDLLALSGSGPWPTEPTPAEATGPVLPQPSDIPFPAQSQARPAAQAGAAFGSLGDWLRSNSSALIGLGAGIAGGSTWGEGLSKGLQNAMGGRALDQQRAANEQTVAALTKSGVDPSMARAAAGNPAMLRALLWRLYAPQARPPSVPGMTSEGPSLRRMG